GYERVHREFDGRLMFDDQAHEPPFRGRVLLGECRQGPAGARIATRTVGVPVMFAMVIEPPAPTPAQPEAAEEQAAELSRPAVAEGLLVTDVVDEKTELPQYRRQVHGDREL